MMLQVGECDRVHQSVARECRVAMDRWLGEIPRAGGVETELLRPTSWKRTVNFQLTSRDIEIASHHAPSHGKTQQMQMRLGRLIEVLDYSILPQTLSSRRPVHSAIRWVHFTIISKHIIHKRFLVCVYTFVPLALSHQVSFLTMANLSQSLVNLVFAFLCFLGILFGGCTSHRRLPLCVRVRNQTTSWSVLRRHTFLLMNMAMTRMTTKKTMISTMMTPTSRWAQFFLRLTSWWRAYSLRATTRFMSMAAIVEVRRCCQQS